MLHWGHHHSGAFKGDISIKLARGHFHKVATGALRSLDSLPSDCQPCHQGMKKSFILAGAISITALLVLAATRTEQSGEFGDLIKKIYAAWSTLDADNA